MNQKDIQDYLDKGMYGAPQVNPDEQRKYLGTFRERIYLSMTIAEMKNKQNLKHFETELKANPQQQLMLNAAVNFSIQNNYMLLAQKNKCSFRIVDTENQSQATAIGLVYVAETAVNIETISVSEKYGAVSATSTERQERAAETETATEKKQGFFSRLFK